MKTRFGRFCATFVLLVTAERIAAEPALAASFVNALSVPGEATDLYDGGSGWNLNRLGGFGSDLYYDRANNTFYGLADSGPARGLVSRLPRIEQFTVEVDPLTGAVDRFQLQNSILLKTADGTESFDGLNPSLLNGDPSRLGLSFDPEGIVRAPNGHFYVADEYGPSLYEFAPVTVGDAIEARLVRELSVPDNLKPVDSLGVVNYTAERESSPPLVHGRQDNRGFEGLAISPSGDTLLAVLQAPLADEGDRSEGRRGRNVRMVAFDTATGLSTAQYIYQLEDIDAINQRVAIDFEDRRQGRRIGVSAIRAVDDHRFLVLERDNRGVGAENPINADPEAADVGTKRLYTIDIANATDVSQLSLAGMPRLPPEVTPVSKTLLVDVHDALESAGMITPEKLEGFAIGPQLEGGQYALVVASDNDSSVLLTDGGDLLDVYADGSTGPVDGDPGLRTLLPSYLFSFALELPDYVAPQVPRTVLRPGDADQDSDFDQMDLVKVQQAAKYLTGRPATWGEGDWNGAPGGSPGQPPAGDGTFDQLDIVAALSAGIYLTGPYHARPDRTDDPNRVTHLLPPAVANPEPVDLLVGSRPEAETHPVVDLPTSHAVPEPSSAGLLGSFLAASLAAGWARHRDIRSSKRSTPDFGP